MSRIGVPKLLNECVTGPQIARVAVAAGLVQPLSLRVSVVAEKLRLTPHVRAALERLSAKRPTLALHELLEDTDLLRVHLWSGKDRAIDELIIAVRQWMATEARDGKAVPAPLAPAAADPLDDHPDEHELRAWAQKNHVADYLLAPVGAVRSHLEQRHAHRIHDVWHVRDVGSVLLAPAGGPRSVPREVRAAAVLYLRERAAVVQRALEEEPSLAPMWEQGTPDPALASVWARLQRARTLLRAETVPRSYEQAVNPRVAIADTAEPVSLLYLEDPGPRWQPCKGDVAPTVGLSLRDGPPLPTCDCAPEKAARACPFKVLAVQVMMAAVSDPANGELRAKMIEALSTPAWERSLRNLDRALDAMPAIDEETDEGDELGWRLAPHAHGWALHAVVLKYKKRGGFGLKKIGYDRLDSAPRLYAWPTDRQVATLLAPVPFQPLPLYDMATQVAVHRAIALLVGHPRVFIGDKGDERATIETGTIELGWSKRDSGELEAVVDLCGTEMSPLDAWRVLKSDAQGGFYINATRANQRVVVAPVPHGLVAVLQVLGEYASVLPAEAASGLLARVGRLSRSLPVHLPSGLKGDHAEASLRPVFRLEARGGGGLLVEARIRPLAEGALVVPGEGATEIYAHQAGKTRWTTRELETERAVMTEELAVLGLDPATTAAMTWELRDPDAALGLLERLQDRAARYELAWTGRASKVSRFADARDVKMRLTSGREWLRVGGDIEVDGFAVSIAAALEAVRDGRRFVPVDEHTWVRLGEPLRAELGALAAAATGTKDNAEISPYLAPALAPLEAAGAHIEAPVRWTELTERMREATHHAPDAPAGLEATLRDYQLAGYQWLSRLARWSTGACLADDMGLGKTVQALALLVERAPLGPALVVCPTSVTFNWAREAARFAPGLRLVELRGAQRRKGLDGLGPGDVAITSYDLLVRDVAHLSEIEFSTMVLDEAQAVKNAETERARASAKVNAAFRVALTGTPVENRSSELWSLFRVLVPGLLGSAEHFRARFANPIEKYDDESRRHALARLVRPFLLRRLKSEVARELPPRTELVEDIELSKDERTLYEAARREALSRLADTANLPPEQRRFQILAAITRLRQLACHPRLIDDNATIPSSKLTRLRELLGELLAEGHRALVFSQFTRHLALVRDALADDGVTMRYLDGSTPEAQRRVEVDAFQRGEGQVFLLSLRAGGIGLNLTAATFVLLLDPWWNPAVEDQAADRAHRIGQDQPVTVIRLVTRGTVEEAILALHADKRALVSALLDGTGTAGALSPDELMDLLHTEPEPSAEPQHTPKARVARRKSITENPP